MLDDSDTTAGWITLISLWLEIGVLRHSDIHLTMRIDTLSAIKDYLIHVAYNTDMFPAIFLDRDGVIIENRSDYVRQWSHVHILPNAVEALSGFQREGFKIIIVTNQSAVGRGLLTFADAQEINDRLIATIKEKGGWVDAAFICPHKPEDNCTCRKPLPGLLLQAASEFSLDLASSWMVGDAWSDLLAGQSAGVQGKILVRTGRGAAQLQNIQNEEIRSFLVCDDVFDAFGNILSLRRK